MSGEYGRGDYRNSGGGYGNQGNRSGNYGPPRGGNYGPGNGPGNDRGGDRGNDRGGNRGDGRDDRGDRPQRRSTPLSELDPELTAISHKVIGLATEVHMDLGSGYSDAIYTEALKHELTAEGIAFKAAHQIPVTYDDREIGSVTADLVIADRFIIEVMAEPKEIGSYERTILRAQLRAADLLLGLIINFAGRRLKDGLVRVINPDRLTPEQRGESAEDHHDEEATEQEA
jgi:GxxExxY protein